METTDAFTTTSFNVFTAKKVEDPSELLDKLDLFYSLLGISLVVRGRVKVETVAYASIIYDEILGELKDHIPEYSHKVINTPIVDSVELAECMGPEALRLVLEWSAKTLLGGDDQVEPGVVEAYSECIGWSIPPLDLAPDILAGAIIASFTGSFNRYVTRIVAEA
ncbi:MAG: hypothetical protein GSR85_00085 [Desulfurococcales archaeon]|nr:hypothetical protein [Desulfurococcales archaeon]